MGFISRNRYGAALLCFLCFFILSCSSQDSSTSSRPASVYVQSVWAGDFAPGQLKAHYLKHRYEFGDITIEEYLNDARTLLNSPPGMDILEKIRGNKDILRYRVSSGEFAVMSSNGVIRTYFKTNYRYWLKQ